VTWAILDRVGETAAPRTRFLAIVLLAAATLLAFAPVLDAGFVDYDDDIYVSANPHIRSGLDAKSLGWAFTSFYASNWHPLTWLSHMIDWRAYGGTPRGHHATSLVLHVASVLALFVALFRMTGAPGRSASVAALFAVHPLHVESVAWLAERKDVLCALFWFLAIGAYARWRTHRTAPRYLAVVAFAALALMSKPMAVTLPLTLVLLDFWPLGRELRKTALASALEKVPLLLAAAASAILTLAAQHAGQSLATMQAVPLEQRFGNAAVAAVAYLTKAAWPVKLAVFYPHPGATLQPWKVGAAVAVLVLISAAAVRLRRARPYLAFGWLWYLVTLLPVIGLVQVGEQSMADRYTYVPLVGIFVAVVWGAKDVFDAASIRWNGSVSKTAPALAAIAVVLVLIGVTRFQLTFWKDGDALFTRALAVTKNNDVAHAHLGMLRAQQKRFAEADAHFREALRIHPGSALAHLDFGTILVELGRTDQALAEFRIAARIDPRDPRIQTNLGGIFQLQGKLDEAAAHFGEAIRLDPQFTAARLGLGAVLGGRGRLDEALAEFDEVLRVDPGSAEAHDRAGAALARLGRYEEAYARFAAAIRIDPVRADAQCNWGSALAAQARYGEAAAHFTEALRIDPGFARAHFSLAAASFFLEDYPGAWREAKLARRYGMEPPADFLAMLSSKMPEPQ